MRVAGSRPRACGRVICALTGSCEVLRSLLLALLTSAMGSAPGECFCSGARAGVAEVASKGGRHRSKLQTRHVFRRHTGHLPAASQQVPISFGIISSSSAGRHAQFGLAPRSVCAPDRRLALAVSGERIAWLLRRRRQRQTALRPGGLAQRSPSFAHSSLSSLVAGQGGLVVRRVEQVERPPPGGVHLDARLAQQHSSRL